MVPGGHYDPKHRKEHTFFSAKVALFAQCKETTKLLEAGRGPRRSLRSWAEGTRL